MTSEADKLTSPKLHDVAIVNHLTIEIACTSDALWALILEDYRDGQKFARAGYRVSPLIGDPAAWLGGYHMAYGDPVIDERICRVTELDPAAYRLSLYAEYLSPAAQGMRVHACYAIEPAAGAVRYRIDSFASLGVAAGGPDFDLKAVVPAMTGQFEDALRAYMIEAKSRLE